MMVCNQITGNIIMKLHWKITRVHISYYRNCQCSCTVKSSCVCCKQLTHPVIYCPVDLPLLVSQDWSTAVSGYFVSLPSIQLSAWWWTCDRSCSKQPVQRVMMPAIKGSATQAWEISPWGWGRGESCRTLLFYTPSWLPRGRLMFQKYAHSSEAALIISPL